MDKTLRQYLADANEIRRDILENKFLNIRGIKKRINKLSSFVRDIQAVSYKIARIHNTCQKIFDKNNAVSQKPETLDTCDVFPSEDVDDVYANTKTVEFANEVPNVSMYWIKSLGQFGIRINGVMLRGNIGQIFSGTGIRTDFCKHENECKKVLSGDICGFYHDIQQIADLYKKGTIKKKTYYDYKKTYLNFRNTSWMYDAGGTTRTKNMRSVGNRSTLDYDLDFMKPHKNRIRIYQSQVLHDILVVLAIAKYGETQDLIPCRLPL